MTVASHTTRQLTYTVDQLVPGITRIRCVDADQAEAFPDPCLSPWARDLLADGLSIQVASAPSLGLALEGSPLADLALTDLSIGDDGAVRIAGALQGTERLYGAYDADAHGLNRRGDVVNLVTELHPLGEHQLRQDDGRGEPPVPLEIGEGVSNYGELHLPIFISSAGYAIYIANHRSRALLDLGAADPNVWSFTASGGAAELYVLGPKRRPDELMGLLGRLLGTQPAPPIWTLGYIQSRFGYESFDHVQSVVERLRAEELPAHGVVLDVQWLEEHVNLRWNPDGFADAPTRIKQLHELGVRVVTITEPGTGGSTSNYPDGVQQGAFARALDSDDVYASDQWYCNRGIPGYRSITPGDGGLVNFFSEDAADWWYDQHRPLLADGVDAWWLDLNEPEDVEEDLRFAPVDWPTGRAELRGDDARNVFALAQQRAFTRRDLASADRRPFLLSRSGAAGSQRYGTSPWSGDIGATWADLRRQTHLLLSAGVCGIPLFGCDVGGFAGTPSPELFTRWMQLATWMPIFRAHGCMGDREPWSQGAEALEAIRPSLVLRGQLLPSLATWMRSASETGVPLCRPLWMDFPGREELAEVADQWMLGPILAAPVLQEGVTSRSVVLPPGVWVGLWDGAHHEGGRTIEVPVTLASNPAFVSAGSVLVADPMPTEHRAMAWPPERLELWSFPDEDGRATGRLVLDDGLTRRYERGAYADLQLTVEEGVLSVERTAGSFPMSRLVMEHPHPGRASTGHR